MIYLLDPRTGCFAPEMARSPVATSTAALADGLATAALVAVSMAGLRLIESFAGCEVPRVFKDLRMVESDQ